MNLYTNLDIKKTDQGVPYYQGKLYPNIPLSNNDFYIITSVGDRLDNLAYNYYGDSSLWRIISAANNNVTRGSLFPQPGTQLRIPTDLNAVLKLFNDFNSAR